MIHKLCALLTLLLIVTTANAADDRFVASGRPGDTISVSLVTFQPGTEYWQRFGHNAILLRESTSGAAITYNYGLFDFRQKNFFLNFARGLMVYKVAPNYLARDLPVYAEDDRWALEQKLDLTPDQRGWIRDYLEWNALPENTEYRYDYFISNCSTRVRDVLDRTLGGALRKQLEGHATDASYRSEALRLISPDLPMFIGMDAALGPIADKPIDLWQQSFAPMTLMQAVRGVQITEADGASRPLVAEESWLLPRGKLPDPPVAAPALWPPFLFVGIVIAATLIVLSRARRLLAARLATTLITVSLSLVFGLAGLVLVAIWTVTDHWAGWHNENLLLMNPLCLLLLPAWFKSLRGRWQPGRFTVTLAVVIAAGSVIAAALREVPGAFQANLHWVLLILPIQLVLAGIVLGRGSVDPSTLESESPSP